MSQLPALKEDGRLWARLIGCLLSPGDEEKLRFLRDEGNLPAPPPGDDSVQNSVYFCYGGLVVGPIAEKCEDAVVCIDVWLSEKLQDVVNVGIPQQRLKNTTMRHTSPDRVRGGRVATHHCAGDHPIEVIL